VYACFASSFIVIAAAPIESAPPAINNLLRLLLLGADLALDPAAPSIGLGCGLAAFAMPFALVPTVFPVGPFATLLAPSPLVANGLSPCILLANVLRCGAGWPRDREHARHVHDGTVPLRRSSGEKV
jgi:hypothetical protein